MSGTHSAKRGKVTILDVAADAGVSKSAVSKVLTNAYGVSEGLRANVLNSINKLGYRPSTAARGMRGQTYLVGVLLVDLANPFVPPLLSGVKSALAGAGYKELIAVGQAQRRIEVPLIESMIDLKMDGLILVAPRLGSEQLAKYASQIPMVVIGHHEPTAQAFDTVNSDDRNGARIAVEAFLAQGHTKIAMLSLPRVAGDSSSPAVEREKGYLDAMEVAGLRENQRIIRLRQWDIQNPDDLIAHFDGELPRAVFCWSDIHGTILINAAKAANIRVPEDMAIIGYDDTPTSAMPLVNLSSMSQQGPRLGEIAARALLSRIEGRTTPRHILVEPSFQRRGSI